jgi:hypothetical protein
VATGEFGTPPDYARASGERGGLAGGYPRLTQGWGQLAFEEVGESMLVRPDLDQDEVVNSAVPPRALQCRMPAGSLSWVGMRRNSSLSCDPTVRTLIAKAIRASEAVMSSAPLRSSAAKSWASSAVNWAVWKVLSAFAPDVTT